MSKESAASGAAPTLFEVPASANPLPRRIQTMHREHGVTEGETCAGCIFLRTVQYRRRFFKCEQSHVSKSTATDWRKSWPACGLYEAGEPPVIYAKS